MRAFFVLVALFCGVGAGLIPHPQCEGSTACVPAHGSNGPHSIVWIDGTGHRDGTCGCIGLPEQPADCVEKVACQSNVIAMVHVGVGNFGNTGGDCKVPNSSGDVAVYLASSGCSSGSTSSISTCSDSTCTSCGASTDLAAGCGDSLCPGRICP
jgi:hypothetical protein